MVSAPETDIAIAGGGPAGLATAIHARRLGLSVRVLEARPAPPIDKACGEGILPGGVEELRALGISLDGAGAPFRGIRFVAGGRSAEGRFPNGTGLGIRRTELHSLLVGRATAAGVEIRWGTRVLGLRGDGVETDSGPLRARFVVGADGLRSRVRQWAGLERGPGGRRRFAVRRHFEMEPWTDLVEVHWGDGCEGYVTPVGERCIGVALTWSGPSRGFDELLTHLPELDRRLAGIPVSSQDMGAGPMHQRTGDVVAGRVALVGDAAGYLDSITGEGLTIAFRSARELAAAIARDDLSAYVTAHRRIVRSPNLWTRLLLEAGLRTATRRAGLAALGAVPGLFDLLLRLHEAA